MTNQKTTPRPETTFSRVGDLIKVDFGTYKPDEVTKIRQIPGRRYDPATRIWSFPASELPLAAKIFPGLAKLMQDEAHRRAQLQHQATAAEYELIAAISKKYPHLYQGFQPQGIAHLMTHRFAICGDDMGLGKTKQAIIAAIEAIKDGHILVICPAGLKGNWALEIREEDPNGAIHIVNGTAGVLRVRNPKSGGVVDFPKGPFESDHVGRWTIINYDILSKHHAELLKRRWAMVILDEAHYIKNDSNRTAYILGDKHTPALLDRADGCWLLTGTPWHNKPVNLFNLLRAARHDLGRSYWKFVTRYCGAERDRWGLQLRGPTNVEELAEKVSDILIQRKKEDVLDLPEKTRQFLPVEIDRQIYGHLEDTFIHDLTLGQLSTLRAELAVAKVGATIAQAEEIIDAGHKVIVFSQFTEPLNRIMAHFGDRAVRVDGGVTGSKRQEAMNAFQNDPGVSVFAGQLIAAGTGITLTAATYVIMNDYDWVPANHHQAEDRAYRIGQRNAVTVYYMHAADTLDDDLQDVFLGKAEVIGRFETWAAQKIKDRRGR
jgi:SWI/SNF-related matrix-associated actin-dependent regulator 1 of chromatin subfamily A